MTVHDDLVERDCTAEAPSKLWLTDVTERPTAEGKLYLCPVKDVYSGKIVGYSMDSRMKSSLAVAALENAVRARRPAGTLVHSDPGSQFRSRRFVESLRHHGLAGSMGRVGLCADNAAILFLAAAEKRPGPPEMAHTPGAPPGDHHLDRKDVSPPATATYRKLLELLGDYRKNARTPYNRV